MSKIKNDRLDQYGARPFEQQQSGTVGIEGVKNIHTGNEFGWPGSLGFKRLNIAECDYNTFVHVTESIYTISSHMSMQHICTMHKAELLSNHDC